MRTSETTQADQTQTLRTWVAMRTERLDPSLVKAWTPTSRAFEMYHAYALNQGGSMPMSRRTFVIALGQKFECEEQKVLGSFCLPMVCRWLS